MPGEERPARAEGKGRTQLLQPDHEGAERPPQQSAMLRRYGPDLIACGLLAAFGLAAIWIGLGYPTGTLNRMGPGFFPLAASAIVVGLAVLAAIETVRTPPVARTFELRPLIFVGVAMLAWVALIDDYGILPATTALILISGLARSPFRPVSLLVLAVSMSILGWLIFVVGLRMPISLVG